MLDADWQLHWCVDKARLRVVLSSFSSSLGERGVHRYFYLALFCDVCSTSLLPRGKGFVLFNGRLFSHLLSARICVQENVHIHTHTHVILAFSCCVHRFVRVWKLREGHTVSCYSANERPLSLFHARGFIFIFYSCYPTRIGWHLVLFLFSTYVPSIVLFSTIFFSSRVLFVVYSFWYYIHWWTRNLIPYF